MPGNNHSSEWLFFQPYNALAPHFETLFEITAMLVKSKSKSAVKLVNKYQEWNVDRNGDKPDLAGIDLSGVDLNEVDLSDANLTGAKLRDTQLAISNLEGVNFTAADLTGADLQGAFGLSIVAIDAIFAHTNLRNTHLCDGDFTNANFTSATGDGCGFRNSKLAGSTLHSAIFTSAFFQSADLTSANLCEANFTGADFTRADLSDAELIYANLGGASLSGAIGYAPVTDRSIALLVNFADEVLRCPDRLVGSFSWGDRLNAAEWLGQLDPTLQSFQEIMGVQTATAIAIPIPEFTALLEDRAAMLEFLASVSGDRSRALTLQYLT
jgi:uncharacterized protein YjbI with pentapeptide repeats